MLWSLKDTLENRRLIEYVATGENSQKLEQMIAKEVEEYNSMPKLTNKSLGQKVENLQDAVEVLSEAKAAADNFLGNSPSLHTPELEIRRLVKFNGRFYPYAAAFGGLVGGGSALFAYGEQIAGGIMIALGLLEAGLALGFKIKERDNACDGKKIIYVTGARRREAFWSLLHEYLHMVSFKQLNGSALEYLALNEGFAQGGALHIMRQGDEISRKLYLLKSIDWLSVARAAVKAKVKGKKGRFDRMYKRAAKGIIRNSDYNRLAGMGYFLFRLAEERHGADVYKEVYSGNTGVLFS